MSPFIVANGLTNPHLQTLLPRLIRRAACFTPVWQTLTTPDNDFLDLAWSESAKPSVDKPIFVLFHGLEGSFYSPYANGLMGAFAQHGWLSVMMHFRGCSGKPNRLARAYHSGETEDARFVLEYLREQFPQRTIIATGVSLGGNMLVNYLARYRDDPIVDAATIISAPLDLAACSQRIEQGFSKVYRRYLLSSLKNNALKKAPLLQNELGLTTQCIRRVSKLYQFDDLITAPLHGFKDAQDYYQQCSGIIKLNAITIPTLIIHAADDPFMTEAVIPRGPLNPQINYQLFEHGGHVGFLTGSLGQPKFWLEQALPSYYADWRQR